MYEPNIDFLVLASALLQDDSPRQVRELIEKLGSESTQERDEGTRKLKELGKAAWPELEKAAKDRDPEVAARAKWILRVIEMSERLPAELRKAMPGIEERLVRGGKYEAWDKELSEGIEKSLGKTSLEVLAAAALGEARTETEKKAILVRIVENGLCRLAPEIVKLLKDTNADIRWAAVRALGNH